MHHIHFILLASQISRDSSLTKKGYLSFEFHVPDAATHEQLLENDFYSLCIVHEVIYQQPLHTLLVSY